MAAGTQQPNGIAHAHEAHAPSTPPEAAMTLSQQSLPSTEDPSSPADPASSFKTEANEDRPASPLVIPSSLTPPPSSQPPQPNGTAGQPLGYAASSQRSSMFSPPATTSAPPRRDGQTAAPAEYAAPTGEQIHDASADELRRLLGASLSENARLKMEIAHHKLQYNLLSMQADEAAKRAAVEHDMTRREVEVLRVAESERQARRDQDAANESIQLKYIQLKASYECAVDDMGSLRKREKKFKKVIQQKEDEIIGLTDDRELLLQRIRENREHFNMLRSSPGGIPPASALSRLPPIVPPQQHRTTPRQTPKSHRREADEGQRGFQVLLQALNHDNISAPSTPTSSHHPTPRTAPKHTRGAQSMSSLPTTPMPRPRSQHSTLLPSIDLVPQTAPVPRFAPAHEIPEPRSVQRRKSRESTISADDNEELARAALSMAAVNRSMMSATSDRSAPRASRRPEEGEEVYESQASQAASEMLRRNPRDSFGDVASSTNSRDVTPAPAEKSMKLQTRLFAPINKSGMGADKRKFAGDHSAYPDGKSDSFTNPVKKLRVEPRSTDARRVGLGIQYSE